MKEKLKYSQLFFIFSKAMPLDVLKFGEYISLVSK